MASPPTDGRHPDIGDVTRDADGGPDRIPKEHAAARAIQDRIKLLLLYETFLIYGRRTLLVHTPACENGRPPRGRCSGARRQPTPRRVHDIVATARRGRAPTRRGPALGGTTGQARDPGPSGSKSRRAPQRPLWLGHAEAEPTAGAALRCARARRAGCGFSAVPLRAPTRHTYVPPQPRAGPLRLPMTIAPKLGTANGHCPASLSPPSQRPLSGPPRCSGQTGPSSGHRRRVGAGRARARDVSKGCPEWRSRRRLAPPSPDTHLEARQRAGPSS